MEKLSQKCIENVYQLVEKNKMKLHTCVDYRHCIIITFLTKAVFFNVVWYDRNPGRAARQ